MTNGNSNPPSTTSVPQMMPSGPVTAVTTGTLIMDTYEIEKLINSGGMGEVYRGRNIHNGEPVAIKIVLPSLAHDPKIVALFQKESTVLSRLSHEAIVRYHTFTIDRSIGRPCMVMEFVSGMPLAERIEQGPMPLDEVKVMFRRVASGLDKAHRAGVVHRDLSPDNVILEEGSVDHAKLIDFGIAKSASFGGGTLLGGQFAGKFNWVAPEQLGAFGGLVDGRSDVYSLALLVAAASRGKVVAMGDSIVDAVGKRAGVPDLTGVDPELLPLLSYMLQPDPARRPENMAAVIAALDDPALVPVVAALTPPVADSNRTVIGGALPIAPDPQPLAGMTASAPPVSPLPAAMSGSGADWSVPGGRPTTSSPATIIAPQVPLSKPPLSGALDAEDVSPFGAPTTPGIAQVAVAPASGPATVKKAKSGLLVVVGLLVLVGGGAGAYFAGLIGGPVAPVRQEPQTAQAAAEQAAAEQAAAEQAAADAAARAAAEQAAADQIAADTAAKAAAAEVAAQQAAAQQAAEEQAAAEQAAAEQAADAAAKVAAEAEAARLAEAQAAADKAAQEAASRTAEQQAAAQRAAEEAAAQKAAEAAAAAKLAEEAAAREAAEAAARAAAEAAAAAARADPLAAQLAWLESAAMPECVHLRPASGDDRLLLEGYATTTGPLEALSQQFAADLGREPELAPRLINDAQCPVIDFANARQSANVPALSVHRDAGGEAVKSGGKITLVVDGINGRPFAVFLFSDAGGATNLKPFGVQSTDGAARFTFTLSMAAGAPPAPQVVLVMATDTPLTKLDLVPNGVTAKSLMPFIEVALKDNTGPTAIGLGFFRLEN